MVKDMREQLKTMQARRGLADRPCFVSLQQDHPSCSTPCFGVVNLEQNNIISCSRSWPWSLMPPTLIASIYGMNFKVIRELEWVHGYPMALVMNAGGSRAALLPVQWKSGCEVTLQ